MSGPIVRKYGFPNFDQIFGKRELEHGVEESESKEAVKAAGQQAADGAAEKGEAKTTGPK